LQFGLRKTLVDLIFSAAISNETAPSLMPLQEAWHVMKKQNTAMQNNAWRLS